MNGTGVMMPTTPNSPPPPDAGGPERSEGSRSEPERSGGVPASRPTPKGTEGAVPDPEVVPKAGRRHYTAEYKAGILREADACTELGAIGALLRREGLYSSLLTTWRRERERGELEALAPKKRGRKPARNDVELENERLRREVAKLKEQLRIAGLIDQAQKKVHELFGIALPNPEDVLREADERDANEGKNS
jgi:transposase-like protein